MIGRIFLHTALAVIHKIRIAEYNLARPLKGHVHVGCDHVHLAAVNSRQHRRPFQGFPVYGNTQLRCKAIDDLRDKSGNFTAGRVQIAYTLDGRITSNHQSTFFLDALQIVGAAVCHG